MTVILKEWNILDHLQTSEDIALYLEACFADAGDDADFIAKTLCDVAKAQHLTLAMDIDHKNLKFNSILHLIKSLGLELHITPIKSAATIN